MEEHEFKKHADDTLALLHRELASASDDYDFKADFTAGALAVRCGEPPAKFVISPNTPARQIWVSAHSKSYKLDWDVVENTFVLTASGQTLKELIEREISRQLGEEITL